MTAGLHFPLVILTTIVFFAFYHWLKRQKNQFSRFLFNQRYTLLIILAILLIGSNLFQLATDFFIYTNRREFSYLDNEVIAAEMNYNRIKSAYLLENKPNAQADTLARSSNEYQYFKELKAKQDRVIEFIRIAKARSKINEFNI